MMNKPSKFPLLQVDNRPVSESKRRQNRLYKTKVNDTKDISRIRVHDEELANEKMMYNLVIKIEFPSVVVRDNHVDNIQFTIPHNLVSRIFNSFILYVNNNNNREKINIQSACPEFLDKFFCDKNVDDYISFYPVEKDRILGKWHSYTPSFDIILTIPVFYSHEGNSLPSHTLEKIIYHDFDLRLNIEDIIGLRNINNRKLVSDKSLTNKYLSYGEIEIPEFVCDCIYTTDLNYKTKQICIYNFINITSNSVDLESENEDDSSNNMSYSSDDIINQSRTNIGILVDKNDERVRIKVPSIKTIQSKISAIYISLEDLYLKNRNITGIYSNGTRNNIKSVTLQYSDCSITLTTSEIIHMFKCNNTGILKISFKLYQKHFISDISESELKCIEIEFDFSLLTDKLDKSFTSYRRIEEIEYRNVNLKYSSSSYIDTLSNNSEDDSKTDTDIELIQRRNIHDISSISEISMYYSNISDLYEYMNTGKDKYELVVMIESAIFLNTSR